MNQWYGGRSRQKLIQRAEAFTQARAGDSKAVGALLEILAKPSEGPLARANAVGYLARFSSDPRVYPAFERAAADTEPLVRAIAVLRMNPGQANRDAAVPVLVRSLGDPVAVVRLGAAVALVGLGVSQLSGADGERFELAKQAYRARAELNSDDPGQQLGAGKFYLLTGDPASAIGAFENSLKLDPEVPARYFLAYAHARQGQYNEAREILLAISPADPQFVRAQELLKAIVNHFPAPQ
jgi:tetratricopeptide (TPR) repeat protein